MRELALEDAEAFRSWIRMDTGTFEELLRKVRPLIMKQDTSFREAIPAGERLAITLRYLATGKSCSKSEPKNVVYAQSCFLNNIVSRVPSDGALQSVQVPYDGTPLTPSSAVRKFR